MADKGFTIRDVLLKKNCQLNIPPFRGSAPQFSTDEIFDTQEIASLRIHVERSIGRMVHLSCKKSRNKRGKGGSWWIATILFTKSNAKITASVMNNPNKPMKSLQK